MSCAHSFGEWCSVSKRLSPNRAGAICFNPAGENVWPPAWDLSGARAELFID